uniref:Pyrin domain-containing protein n=1 Tax=Ascaris lumbricoides TaxID=6252 RepID=A0A0M3HLW7_ASCLU
MHRNLSTEATESKQFAAFMRLMSPRLIRIRFKLEQEFISGLSSLDDPDQVSNQLAAIAVLKKYNLEELLDIFLQQKMVSSSSSRPSLSSHKKMIISCSKYYLVFRVYDENSSTTFIPVFVLFLVLKIAT